MTPPPCSKAVSMEKSSFSTYFLTQPFRDYSYGCFYKVFYLFYVGYIGCYGKGFAAVTFEFFRQCVSTGESFQNLNLFQPIFYAFLTSVSRYDQPFKVRDTRCQGFYTIKRFTYSAAAM